MKISITYNDSLSRVGVKSLLHNPTKWNVFTNALETTGGYLANDKKRAYNVGIDNRYSKILTLLIPDAQNTANVRKVTYETPVVKVQEYTKEEIFKKDLVAFLPYYIMRYEKQLPAINTDKEQLQELLKEYEEIRDVLSVELQGNNGSALFIDLIKLILRISDYFLASEEEVKKGVADIMGGTVLQLESERLFAEDIAQGGLAMLVALVNEGTITLHAAAEKAKMTDVEFIKLMEASE